MGSFYINLTKPLFKINPNQVQVPAVEGQEADTQRQENSSIPIDLEVILHLEDSYDNKELIYKFNQLRYAMINN